ncbi:MAG: CD3324 family protein [Roseburia sp.]|nr:CD3324 family protein [Roseburia sp.]MCM1096761.1 CD3324 family protein [Ruminococcus flavefaciens]
MSYKKAEEVLPRELLASVQQYVDGQMLYIPRRAEEKRTWGSATETRKRLELRNAEIYAKYCEGISVEALADTYFLTGKSVQRIIRRMKPSEGKEKSNQPLGGKIEQRKQEKIF